MSKKVSQQIKAQRKQHRADHYTDADRKLGKVGKKARRAARQESFNAQGNKSASDFNFDQYGKGHIGGQEIRHLQNQGHSKEDIMSAAKAHGGEIGKRAQKRFDNWGAAKEKAQTVKDNPVATTQPAVQPSVTKDSYNTETGDNTNAQQVDNSTNTNVQQDNDITTTINGNDNNVNNAQDNSVNTMGGSSRTGNYQNSGVGSNGGERTYQASVMPKDYKEHPMPGSSSVTDGSYNSSTGANKSAQQVDSSTNLNAIQDNDINTDIEGDNNYVYNRQDNSVRNYGGDTRVFNYQSSGNPALDSPVSAATMGGYYDVDDSPGARAARLDQEITMANDYSKGNMDTDWIAKGAKHKAGQDSYIDPAALDNRIRAREAASFAASKKNQSDMWGDVSQYGWGKPEDPEPVEVPDFEKIGNAYTDF
jgi:hypothetical protein